jgi:hypothetical protein
MLCTTEAKIALDACCPATEKSNLPVDERGQPFRRCTKQWARFHSGIITRRPEDSWAVFCESTESRDRVSDMAAALHIVACRRMSEDQFPALQKRSGPMYHTIVLE